MEDDHYATKVLHCQARVDGQLNFWYWFPSCGQTIFGQTLDRKYSLCPMSVKTLSNDCPITRSV